MKEWMISKLGTIIKDLFTVRLVYKVYIEEKKRSTVNGGGSSSSVPRMSSEQCWKKKCGK
jgi:hypothetical protein